MWRRLARGVVGLSLLAGTIEAAAPADNVRSGEVEQSWFRATQALDAADGKAFRARCDELVALASKHDLHRLTPFALAVLARARTVTGEDAERLLKIAVALDPGSPEAHFALASHDFGRLAALAGARSLARAARALVTDGRHSHVVWGAALISGLCALLGGFALWALIAVRRALAPLWHDLMEMAGHWRLGPNGGVVAVVALALPLFAGGDVVWLVLWVFALCWAYFGKNERVIGFTGLALVAVTPSLLEIGFRSVTRNPNGILQAAATLAEKRYDPQVLDELDSLEDLFIDSPDYYRLAGDVHRQFGLLDGAAWAYREGLQRAPDNGALALALGTVRYLEGDYNAALQAFQTARSEGADAVVVNYNLALTFAETYHFREGDEAMERARSADAARLRRLTRGHDHEPIRLPFAPDEARALMRVANPVTLMHRGLLPPPLLDERTFAHPLTLAAFVALLFAIGHFLMRDRTTSFASTCLKCGRPFCHRCRLSQERQSYCAQCVNIFLKKDTVGIDSQMSKRRQVARHQLALRLERRVGDVLLPGLGLVLSERVLLGGILAAGALAASAIALLWLPLFIAPALSSTVWPAQAAVGVVWLALAVAAQLVPTVGR